MSGYDCSLRSLVRLFATGCCVALMCVLSHTPIAYASGIAGTTAFRPHHVQTADAGSALSLQTTQTLRGGYIAAGTGLRNRGYGTITISGIPSGASVANAYLVWDVLDDTQAPDLAAGQLNGTPIQGTLTGSGPSPCWPASSNFSYFADVTQLVTGNGTYSLAGFASGATDASDPWVSGSPAPEAEGASLVVVYEDTAAPSATVQLYTGAQETQGEPLTADMSGFTAGSGAGAQSTFIVADGQGAGSDATFNGNDLDRIFLGADPIAPPPLVYGNLWDTYTTDVGGYIQAGDTQATATVDGTGDCLVWVGQVLSVPSGSRPTLTLAQDPSASLTNPVVDADSGGWTPGETVNLYLDSEFGATWVANERADPSGDANFSAVILPEWLVNDGQQHLNDCQGAYKNSGCGYVLTAMGDSEGSVGEVPSGFMLDTSNPTTPISFPGTAAPSVTNMGKGTDPGCSMPGLAGTSAPRPALPLTVSGRWVVDHNGKRFKFNSVNWYGAEEADFVPAGLECRSVASIASTIAALDFNSVRLPWSNAMLELNPSVCHAINPDNLSPWNKDGEECIPSEALAANPSMQSKSALQIYRDVIDALAAENLGVVLDNHSTDASFTPSPYEGFWWGGKLWDDRGNSAHPAWRVRTRRWESDWVSLLQTLKSDPNHRFIVGADLRNEPGPAPAYGKTAQPAWPTGMNTPPRTPPGSCIAKPDTHDATEFNWVEAAEAGGDSVLCADPSLLVMVEGVSDGSDLSGVLQYSKGSPVVTSVILNSPPGGPGSHLVYSVHDYPSCSLQCLSYSDLITKYGDEWGYLLTQGQPYTAPVWVGEFGANESAVPTFSPTTNSSLCYGYKDDGPWFNCFVNYLQGNDADWSYWAINGTEADAGIHDPADPRGLTADESYGILTPAWDAARATNVIDDLQQEIGPPTQGPGVSAPERRSRPASAATHAKGRKR